MFQMYMCKLLASVVGCRVAVDPGQGLQNWLKRRVCRALAARWGA